MKKMNAIQFIEGKEFLSTTTIAWLMDESIDSIQREITNGKLKAKKKGRNWKVPVQEYEAWKAKFLKSA